MRDKCRHCHAIKLYKNVKENGFEKITEEEKEQLVIYFRNKERVLPANSKNHVIYQDTIENSFQEILRLYGIYGNNILYCTVILMLLYCIYMIIFIINK